MTSAGWLERVAERANTDVDTSNAILMRRGIRPERPLQAAHDLAITKIFFSGEKQGRYTGPFEFNWDNLGPGIYAVTSHDNLVGKSTVLEILLWALRGEPKGLQDDVRGWLHKVNVEFRVDDQLYSVEFTLEQRIPTGRLFRISRPGERIELDRFSSDAGFEAAMSRFMMNVLDLEPLPSRQENSDTDGRTVNHGWNALSGAMYFGGDHKVLLGDVTMSGLPARMLQIYVGLPWAQTRIQASTAKKEVAFETSQAERAASAIRAEYHTAQQRIQSNLELARRQLAEIDDEASTIENLEESINEATRLSAEIVELDSRLTQSRIEAEALRAIADVDEREFISLREDVLAVRFFNGLSPTCCPRCETSINRERRQRESTALNCSLCSEPVNTDSTEDYNIAFSEAESRRDASLAAVRRAEANFNSLIHERDRLASELNTLQTALSTALAGSPFRRRREAELEVARYEGALRDYQVLESTEAQALPDGPVVEAAFIEASALFDASRGDLLRLLNTEILRLGQAFGVRGLEEVMLDANARMKLRKGGEETYFSRLTEGERLRLRISTAIALLRIGQTHGVGRHPGLIIIDSPGAEETSELNLASLLEELRTISAELSNLQVFVASANAPSIISVLNQDNCRVAAPGEPLW